MLLIQSVSIRKENEKGKLLNIITSLKNGSKHVVMVELFNLDFAVVFITVIKCSYMLSLGCWYSCLFVFTSAVML